MKDGGAEFHVWRVRGIRLRAQKGVPAVEVDVGGHIEPLTPLAMRALIVKCQEALALAEGRR